MTYEELSHLTWGDLSHLTWADLEQPIDVLYERYRDSQLPLTANAADKLRRLVFALPESMRPVKNPETHSETVEFLKIVVPSLTKEAMPHIVDAVAELIKSLFK